MRNYARVFFFILVVVFEETYFHRATVNGGSFLFHVLRTGLGRLIYAQTIRFCFDFLVLFLGHARILNTHARRSHSDRSKRVLKPILVGVWTCEAHSFEVIANDRLNFICLAHNTQNHKRLWPVKCDISSGEFVFMRF